MKERKTIRDQEKKQIQERLFVHGRSTNEIWSKDNDFKELRRNYDPMFAKKFNEAYTKYIDGDWATAEDIFTQCLKINPNDGPTRTIKRYIENQNGRAPENWKGFRELTDK